MASCTLDASTKIYAYRVDIIHTDTLKIAGGLGRTKDKPEGDAPAVESEMPDAKGKKRKVGDPFCSIFNQKVSYIHLEPLHH